MNAKTLYTLTLTPAAGNWRTPPEARLRAALKCLLRAFGLRCLNCRPVAPPDALAPDNIKPSTPLYEPKLTN